MDKVFRVLCQHPFTPPTVLATIMKFSKLWDPQPKPDKYLSPTTKSIGFFYFRTRTDFNKVGLRPWQFSIFWPEQDQSRPPEPGLIWSVRSAEPSIYYDRWDCIFLQYFWSWSKKVSSFVWLFISEVVNVDKWTGCRLCLMDFRNFEIAISWLCFSISCGLLGEIYINLV